ncbi:MAG: dTDP-glucose 4,6-dehydratase [Chloroflexota bacterium]
MKNILVTGGAGFIGSEFVRHMVRTHPEFNIIAYDKLTYAGNPANLTPVADLPNYQFVRGDIADREMVRSTLDELDVDMVVNFAAETHVDRSILDPDAFVITNTVGVNILLDAAGQHGVGRFLHVSTDEVYGDIEGDHFSVENDPFAPNSPYAASKAGGELMVRSYFVTHGLNTVITRGSNTYGPYQYPEKLMPFFITEALDDRPLPLYGDGMQQRDWLHVHDHCTGIETALLHGAAGEAYNVAGETIKANIEVTKTLLSLLDKPETLIKHVPDREGHDRRYAMNCDKLRALGWQQQYTFEDGVQQTVDWYLNNEDWWRKIKTGEYLEYYRRQYAARLEAAE